jgi:hypothetical protein
LSSRFHAVAVPRSFGSWFHWCLPGASVVSFRASVLSGFLLQIYSWSDSSAVPVRPMVLYDCVPEARVPCVVPLLHSVQSPCRLRPIPSAVYDFPGSDFS